jgi:hypothetical protein
MLLVQLTSDGVEVPNVGRGVLVIRRILPRQLKVTDGPVGREEILWIGLECVRQGRAAFGAGSAGSARLEADAKMVHEFRFCCEESTASNAAVEHNLVTGVWKCEDDVFGAAAPSHDRPIASDLLRSHTARYRPPNVPPLSSGRIRKPNGGRWGRASPWYFTTGEREGGARRGAAVSLATVAETMAGGVDRPCARVAIPEETRWTSHREM